MRKLLWPGMLALCLCVSPQFSPTLWATPLQETEEEQEAKQAEADDAAAEAAKDKTIKDLLGEYDEAMQDFRKRYTAAEPGDRQKVAEEYYPDPNKYANAIMKIAEEDPASEESGEGLVWVMQRTGGAASNSAADLLLDHHGESELLADVAMSKMRGQPTEDNQAFLQRLVDESPVDRVKAVAAYAKVMQIQYATRSFNYMKSNLEAAAKKSKKDENGDPEGQVWKQAKSTYDAFIDGLSDDARTLLVEGELADGTALIDMIENVAREHGDVKLSSRGDTTIGDRCEGIIFEAKYLAIGKVAPDIEGSDLDGEDFKLSDYRGKVVVIDFWGDW